MKKLLLAVFVLLCVVRGYTEPIPADDILAFVRTKLPADPLKLTGSLKIKSPNGYTKDNLPVEMELDWGADAPMAKYKIGDESLTITWKGDVPNYQFSNPKNKPTGDIMGSGVNWTDLSFSVFWWPNSRLVDEGKKLDRLCYIVDVPVPDSENTMRLWVEKNMGMLLESQTLNKKGKAIRRLKIKSIKRIDGLWIGSDMEIKNMLTGSKTDLIVKDLEWQNPRPAPVAFEPMAFDPVASVNQFSIALYKNLSDKKDGNLFFSPYSISTALAMTYGGARGETAGQMNSTLKFGGQGATHPAFSHLRKTLNGIQEKGHIQLSIANSLWPQVDYTFLPDYIALVKEFYGSEIETVDYKSDAEGARNKINIWVEDQTNKRIKNLIPEGAVDGLTRLVLANAIYFKGNWASRFNPAHTRPAPFKLGSEETVEVPMMSNTAQFKLARGDGFQALQLPYEGNDLSMLVLLPGKEGGLTGLETNLTEEIVAGLEFRDMKVMVMLPKFKLESAFGLGDTLKAMGMPLAFSDAADFSGMDGSRKLHIDAVVHKAFVEVNEEGTEAAAATGVAVGVRSMPPQFIANHPFLFLIRENSTGTILFIGRVMDPSA